MAFGLEWFVEVRMPEPSEAYKEGYAKGEKADAGGFLASITTDMLRDDPGGYYAAGYADGAAGREYKVHGAKQSKAGSRKPSSPALPTALESQWYALCDGSEFIPKEIVDKCVADLNAAGSHVAAIIGLSPFTSHTCPRCGRSGHFRVHFLGRLQHPGACGWEGYMKTGSYIGHQIAQIFHTGAKATAAMDDERQKKSDRVMYGIFGFLVVAIYRALAALILIPLHTIIALTQPRQTQSDVVVRVTVLVVYVAGAIWLYGMK
jgi:hypothetical protein